MRKCGKQGPQSIEFIGFLAHTEGWTRACPRAVTVGAHGPKIRPPPGFSAGFPPIAGQIGEEKPVPDGSFSEADENGNQAVCVKDTPSGQLLIKDDNLNTPSQPCPPSYAYTGKGKAVKINNDWLADDANANGNVCVKEVAAGRFIVKDDNLATPSQPCPPAYLLTTIGKGGGGIPAGPASEADDNLNGLVCIHIVAGTGNAIVRDDNLATPSQPCPPSYSVEGVGKKK